MKKLLVIAFILIGTIIYAQDRNQNFANHIQTQLEIYETMAENLSSKIKSNEQNQQWVQFRNRLAGLRYQLNQQEIQVNNAIRDGNKTRMDREFERFNGLMDQLRSLQSEYNTWLRNL